MTTSTSIYASCRTINSIDRLVQPTMSDGSPASVVEPIDLETVKKVLRFTSDSENDLISGWIAAARQHFEEQTGRQIITAQREYILDGSPSIYTIQLPRPPLQAVTAVVSVDDTGAETAFTGYVVTPTLGDFGSPASSGVVDPHCPPGELALTAGGVWPTLTVPGSLRIRYTAGYADSPADVPQLIKAALYLIVGHLHRNRSEVGDQRFELPLGARAIIRAFRDSALRTQQLRTF